MAGQVGVDEGGILQAVSTPFEEEIVETFKYNKKGLLTEKVTIKTRSVTMAEVLTVAVAGGLVTFAGPRIGSAASQAKDSIWGFFFDEEGKFTLDGIFGKPRTKEKTDGKISTLIDSPAKVYADTIEGLKQQLDAGEITLEEFDRLVRAIRERLGLEAGRVSPTPAEPPAEPPVFTPHRGGPGRYR